MIQIVHISFAFLCIFASFSKNRLLWKSSLRQGDIARVRMFDKLSAAMAGLLILSGLAMLFWFAKPTYIYTANPLFWLKMVLFVVASALIIWTKKDLRAAAASGVDRWIPPLRVRAILGFDFIGLFILVALGRTLATGTL